MPTFGILTGGGSTFPTTNDRAILSKFTAPGSGTVTQINQRWHSSSTGADNFKGLIYAADGAGGIPGTRLGIGNIASVPAGGGDIASGGLSVAITGGVDYWIGSVIDAFSAVWECDAAGPGLSRMESCTYGTPAATWTQSGTGGATVNVYATYTAGTPPARVGKAFKAPSQLYGKANPFQFDKNKNAPDIFVADFFDTPTSGGPTTYTITPSGGFTLSGIAAYQRTNIIPVSGGLVFGGVAPYSKTNIIPVSGGLVFSGAATYQRTRQSQVSGGISLSGIATYLRTKIQQVSGGLLFSGVGGYSKTKIETVSGGIVYGGTGPMVFVPAAGGTTYTMTVSGGFTLSGAATYLRTKLEQVSGGILLSGAAIISKTKNEQVSGGVIFNGTGSMQFIPAGGGGGGDGTRDSLALNWHNTLGI